MLAFTLRRLLAAIPVLLGITVLAWLITTTNPNGGPLTSILGQGKSVPASVIAATEHKYGLDKPLPAQYLYWLRNLARGDLGNSTTEHMPVFAAIQQRLLPTVLLLATVLILREVSDISLGLYAASRRGSFFDQLFTVIAYVLYALPTFWYGLMLIVLFAMALQWLPLNGMNDVRLSGTVFGTDAYWQYFHAHTIEAVTDLVRHMIMPVTVLVTSGFAASSRYVRASMLGVLGQDYIRTARAKGLPEKMIIWKHAMRNAILPEVTNIGLALPGLVGGAVITEQIFAWPGMGRLFVNAAQGYDYPLVIGYIVLLGILTLFCNIMTDIAYAYIDPRIRLA